MNTAQIAYFEFRYTDLLAHSLEKLFPVPMNTSYFEEQDLLTPATIMYFVATVAFTNYRKLNSAGYINLTPYMHGTLDYYFVDEVFPSFEDIYGA